eukprot:10950431-Prorocentrum_lima.AAC.1
MVVLIPSGRAAAGRVSCVAAIASLMSAWRATWRAGLLPGRASWQRSSASLRACASEAAQAVAGAMGG